MSHVLVVDDSATIRAVIRSSLTMAGLPEDQIQEAKDGQEALEAIQANRPHLVISDVNMPRMTGLDLLRALREDPAHQDLPVVIVTSVSNSLQLLEVVRQGAHKVIRKPFDPVQLPQELQYLLPRSEVPMYEEPVLELPQEAQAFDEAPDRIDEHMGPAVSSLMERMLFAMVERTDHIVEDRLLVGASIEIYNGPMSRITVLLPLETAHPLAERMLGQEVDPKDEITVFDCVGELANMLVGELLFRIDGEDSTASFGLPERIALPPGTAPSCDVWSYDVDQGEHQLMVGVCR